MDFDTARQRKFEQGRKEHGQPWDAAHVDARREMQGELCDLYNYAELLGEVMKVRVPPDALKCALTKETPIPRGFCVSAAKRGLRRTVYQRISAAPTASGNGSAQRKSPCKLFFSCVRRKTELRP